MRTDTVRFGMPFADNSSGGRDSMINPRDCDGDYANETILVVEDSDPIRRVVCAMLSQNGYTCLEAANGSEALTLLRTAERIQLVLTDVVMPKMDGAELANHMAREYPSVPILFMSGYTDNPLVRAIERSPIFLPKPFTATALTTTVRWALEEPWQGLAGWRRGSISP
jgi:two-component system, cell cycle sensor histidine kinase and response regulator CckA